jgi:uncharacterized pyridoxal phosphate-containing UPF0001 family protein
MHMQVGLQAQGGGGLSRQCCETQPAETYCAAAAAAAVMPQIEMGSTNIRVGSTIFGARDYSKKP